MFLTIKEQVETGRWAVLATDLNGAFDTGKYDHLDTTSVLQRVHEGDIFQFLETELRGEVHHALAQLTDVDRHRLLQHWRIMAQSYETDQFHVRRSGLALLVAYLLHLIAIRQAQVPK